MKVRQKIRASRGDQTGSLKSNKLKTCTADRAIQKTDTQLNAARVTRRPSKKPDNRSSLIELLKEMRIRENTHTQNNQIIETHKVDCDKIAVC